MSRKCNKRNLKSFFYTFQKMHFCVSLVFMLFIFQSFVISDDIKNNTIYELEMNYTMYDAVYNDSEGNITMANQSMNYFDIVNKSSINNISGFDVATELESSISVTEDSDNTFQSETNRKLFLTPDEDICNCDLSNTCDINCCCDPDCTEIDMQVFSECSHQVLTPDENYCYQKNIILKNNTVYKMIKNPKNGMFCIVHDNFKHHLRFKDMPVLKSHRDLITILKYKYKTTHSWDSESENVFDSSESKAGNPIYIDVISYKKIITSRWSLPSSCLSDICSCQEEIRFLEDFKSSCSYVLNNVQRECESNNILSGDKFSNFCIIRRSAFGHSTNSLVYLINHAKMSNSTGDDEYYSSQLEKVCVNRNPKRPKKDSTVCKNVVKHIHFKVEQDGTNGITEILADFKYADITFDKNFITQSYSVQFVWNNISEVQRKSGNPGYQIGLPVLAATNGSDTDSEEISKIFYENGLSVLDKDSGSFCTNNRQTIKFGKNLKSGCIIKHDFTDCIILQNRVSDILLGPSKKQIFVGVFGNSNVSNPEDWIEVFHGVSDARVNGEDCFVSLSLKIDIIYAAVGTVANPQNKIVGVGYDYTKSEFIDLTCVPLCKDIFLSTSVSFFDVTLPAVEHYAKVPSIKANLPSDFFYPFLYGKSSNNVCNAYFILILFCFYYYNIEFVAK